MSGPIDETAHSRSETGVYAYFNYVSDPSGRRAVQNWWKKWLKENKK